MDLLFILISTLVLYSLAILFIWVYSSTGLYPRLQIILPYLSLLYPLILLVAIFQYLNPIWTWTLIFLVSLGMGYYLFVFTPSYSTVISEETIDEGFNNPPEGPVVKNQNWSTTSRNTKYYSGQTSLDTQSFKGQAGPCLQDDRFGYQLGFGKNSKCQSKGSLPAVVPITPPPSCPTYPHPTNCRPISSTDFESVCRSQHGLGMKELDDCGCPKGQTRAVCEVGYSGGVASTDLKNSTSCLRMDLPPFPGGMSGNSSCLPMNNNPDGMTTDANANFWCRYHQNTRNARSKKLTHGAAAGCYQQNQPIQEASRAQCVLESQKPDMNTITSKCLSWNLPNWIWQYYCPSGKFKGKIVSDCPPNYGRASCQVN